MPSENCRGDAFLAEVVHFQNNSITSAVGRLAEAATLKAQPTRKLTFKP